MSGGKKEHVEKVRESKFNRQRCETDELRSNCGREGYVFTNTVASGASAGSINAAGQCEFHHVLPISSLQDGEIKTDDSEELDFIHKCMAKTTWDINKKPNLLGLPTKRPYEQADRQVANSNATVQQLTKLRAITGQFGALPDLPCHLNDHPKYTAKLIDELNTNVWSQLLDNREECEDKGKNIRSTLQTQSKNWKSWLKTRGGEHGGAADCWVNRETKKSVWYIPLSMDPGTPQKIDPPPNIFKKPKPAVRAWLETMFSAVV
jgi:hypothetical protein